jgi:uncharacterized protein (TIGR03118 family)
MCHPSMRPFRSLVGAVVCALVLAACSDSSSPTKSQVVSPFVERKIVGDNAAAVATVTDANLLNPWGVAFNTTSTMWVSDNGSGFSTVYDTAGTKAALVVTIPSRSGPTGGTPTGVVFNTATTGFVIPTSTSAHWIFADQDGTIAAWSTGTSAKIVADRSATGAVYKGLALAANGNARFLFVANFGKNAVDVFDSTYTYVKSFTDSSVAAGYAPFGIAAVGAQLYVTYALRVTGDSTHDQPGAGHGYVDIFNTDGTLAKHLISNGALNSPWGVAVAPASFGAFGSDVLVGNFGDGHINAYMTSDGTFVGAVGDSTKTAIAIDGLWALAFGPGAASGNLYFSAGPGGGTHGLIGILTPKPATP